MTDSRVPSRLERQPPQVRFAWPLRFDVRTGEVSLEIAGNSPFYFDPTQGLNMRATDGLVVSSASPFALRMVLAPGLALNLKGQIGPVESRTVKVQNGALVATVTANDVLMTTNETIAAAIVDLRVNKVALTSPGYVAALAAIADHAARIAVLEAAMAAMTARQIIAGSGLSGGGALDADRTLSASFGTGATNCTRGDDNRLPILRGTATLVAGTVTISLASIQSGSQVFVKRRSLLGTLGIELRVTITAGASFTVTSLTSGLLTQVLDVSTIDYVVFT